MNKVPEGWEKSNIASVCDVVGGGTPARDNPTYWGGTIPWAAPTQIANLNKVYISNTQECITEEGLRNSSAKIHPIGTVLMTSRATIGFTAINTVPMATNQGFQSLRCKENINNLFLHFTINFRREDLIKIAAGSTFLEISPTSLREFSILLPPLSEQKKIAEILSSVDHSIEATDKLIAKLEDLKKALMQELFTKGIGHTRFKDSPLGRIPEAWEVVRLEDVLESCMYGTSQPLSNECIGLPVLRMGNIQNGKLEFNDLKYACFSEADQENLTLRHGDILFNRTNSEELVGKLAIFLTHKTYAYAGYLIRLRTNEKAYPSWLIHLLHIYYEQGIMKTLATPGVSQFNINASNLKAISIVLPPLQEQTEIASILSANDAKIEKAKSRLNKLQDMKKGLMQDLLTGKVRTAPVRSNTDPCFAKATQGRRER